LSNLNVSVVVSDAKESVILSDVFQYDFDNTPTVQIVFPQSLSVLGILNYLSN